MNNRTTTNAALILGGVSLAAVAGIATGSGAVLVPAIAGVLVWLAGVAGNHAHQQLSAMLNEAPPDADEVFPNHQIHQLLLNAARTVVEKGIECVRETHGSASPALNAALKTVPAQLGAELDKEDSPLSGMQEFNLPDLLTEYATSEGRIALLGRERWAQFIQTRLPDLIDYESEALITGLHEHFGEALWNLVKINASTDRQGFAAVELLYLSRLLKAVEALPDGTPPDLTLIVTRIAALLNEIDQKQRNYFLNTLTDITAVQSAVTTFHAEYHTDQAETKNFHLEMRQGLTSLGTEVQELATSFYKSQQEATDLQQEKYIGSFLEPEEKLKLQRELEDLQFRENDAARTEAYSLIDDLTARLRRVSQLENGESVFRAINDDPQLKSQIYPDLYHLLAKFCKAAKSFATTLIIDE